MFGRWELPACGGLDLVVDCVELVVEGLDPALDAAEHAGSAAIPSTTSDAANFALIPAASLPLVTEPPPSIQLGPSQGD